MQFRRFCPTLVLLCLAAVPLAAKPMNPNLVTLIGSDAIGVPVGIDAVGNHAYVTNGATLFELDLDQHGPWSLVDSLDPPSGARKVVIHGNHAYVTAAVAGAGVRIIDAAGAGGPHGEAALIAASGSDHALREIGAYEFDGWPADLAVPDGFGYVADTASDLVRVFRAQDPELGEEVTTIPYPASALAVKGGRAYFAAADRLAVFDVSDPFSALFLGECSTPTSAASVAVRDGWVYLASFDAGLVVVDARVPTGPAVAATLPLPGDVYDVALHGCYAYAAAGLAGLRIVDITSPTSPVEVGFYPTVGEATAVAIQGDRIYVADAGAGLVFLRSAPGFSDVNGNHWAYRHIQACYRADIVGGYPDGSYQPELAVTRAQMAVYLARGVFGGDESVPSGGGHSFGDVAGDHWACRYIKAVGEQGIAQGYPDGGYHPDETVSRAQIAVFMARAHAGGDPGVGEANGDPSFPDVGQAHWAFRYIEYAVESGILQGFPDGSYQPDATVTRDQMAAFVQRTFSLPM